MKKLAALLILTVAVMLFETLPMLYAQQKIENAPLRVWSGPVFGGATIHAVLVEIGDKNVTLLTTDGRQLVVALARLSEADQAHLRKTYNASIPISTDIGDHAGLLEAIRKYYQTVDRAKQVYANELSKALVSFQKAGNLAAYNAVDAELEHTVGKTGHQLTELKFPARSALERQKSILKQAVDAARAEFKKSANTIASDLLKNNQVGQARDVEALANAEEPPRFYIEKTKIEITVPEPQDNQTRAVEPKIPTIDMQEYFSCLTPPLVSRRFTGHTKGVVAMDWSSDGSKIVSAGVADDTFMLWDAKSGKLLKKLENDKSSTTIGFSPDGKQILCDKKDRIILHDIISDTIKWEQGGGTFLHHAKISPDGTVCCTTDKEGDRNVVLRNMKDGLPYKIIDSNGQQVVACNFNSTGTQVVTGWGRYARVWDVRTGKLLLELSGMHKDVVRACTFSPDDRLILTGSMDHSVVMWDAKTGKPIKRLANFHQGIVGMVFSHDGTKLAVSRYEIGGIILSTKTWTPISFTIWTGWWCGQQPAWSPDDSEIVTGHDNGHILVSIVPDEKEIEQCRTIRKAFLNIPTAKLKKELSTRPGAHCIFGQFTPDSQKFIVNSHQERIAKVFDIQSGKMVSKLSHPPAHLNRTDIHPNGKWAATGSHGKSFLWNIEDGSVIHEINAHAENRFTDGVKFSRDGSFFVTGSQDQTAAAWDTATGKELMRFKGHVGTIWAVDITPDGKTLATIADNRDIIIWDIKTGRQLHRLIDHPHYSPHALTFNHKGNILATGCAHNVIILWDTKTWKPVKIFRGYEGGVISVNFSPDDSKLAVGCMNSGFSFVLDVKTGMPLYKITELVHINRGYHHTAVFSPDGTMIATCTRDPIQIWEVPSDAELKQWNLNLENERKSSRIINLTKMPLENAQATWDSFAYGTYTLGGRVFPDTLWAHSYSRYAYRLDKKWKTFKTSYGILERDRGYGTNFKDEAKCVFIVRGDGRELFRSEIINDSKARDLTLDVDNVELLELIVDPNGPNNGDRAVWASPLLSR